MRTLYSISGPYGIGGLALLSLFGTQPEAHATTIQTLYDFDGAPSTTPDGPLIADADGNLYGLTEAGGTYAWGSVYRLSPPPAGGTVWHLTTLYSFRGTDIDGGAPSGTLALDAAGNLYGTGIAPGTAFRNGFVFKISPPQAGHTVWTESVLHRFVYPGPYQTGQNIIVDTNGNLYGFGQGGAEDCGFVFELSPPATGHTAWGVKILHEFTGPDGASNPYESAYPLTIDAAGVLYGTTAYGGTNSKGTIFRLTPPASGHTVWTEKVLYNVQGFTKGSYPTSPVIADSTGALYGTLASGTGEPGQIYKLTPPAAGHTVWTESTIFKFSQQNPAGGFGPNESLAFDASGALYGETFYGGANKAGVVFKLTPPATGTGRWSETVLSSLAKPGGGLGVPPTDGLVADQNGNIFGVQTYSKSDGQASVFEIKP